MKICTKCKEEKMFTAFCKQSKSKDGYQPACKDCMAISYNNSRNKKKDHYLSVARLRRNQIQKQVSDWKTERGCLLCSETFGPCLELHHTNPKEKEGDPSLFANQSFEAFLQEAAKCVILCANCHRKVHFGDLII
jgi:5-methylcytosine-specific restriction endonuclease McrA